MNLLPGQPTAIPQQPQSLALTELTQIVYELAGSSRHRLLYNADVLVSHIEALVTESIDNIHALSRELTPDMHETLTNRCQVVASLVPLVKQSPQLQRYPETVGKNIIGGLEYLCLIFHRQLYRVFSADYQLPHSYLKMEVTNAGMQYQRLLSQYPNNKLLKAMLRPIEKFIHNTSANNTKKSIDYNNVLLSNIKLWQRRKGTQDELYEIALTMNLNCPRFMHYMASEAGLELQSFEKRADKGACIERLQKLFLQASTSTKWKASVYGAYLPDVNSVSTEVQKWLSQQADLVKLEAAAPAETSGTNRVEMQEEVEFFSILLKVMILEGLTKLKKVAPIFRVFSTVISFAKSAVPSEGNLIRAASRRVDGALLDKLEAFFERCLLLVRKIRRNGGKFPDEGE
ncbi:hypothetical protein HNQ91_001037 [Filimonas zeae]|uniref:Uncharacterized protein n=1 Tax=Filimonas zeae TaxID=1737353 RepID=A0A917MSR9_9BACT|nr:hypothetical protein [Filimonas zeae]MDR6338015.1 hypothetical protein [Filimonas zeae]GGH61300.1 hypothetical protein GCM10011379_10140 [Filimonas zeae]